MVAVGGVEQLAHNPDPRAGLADAALEHVADAQLAADLLHVDGTPLVGEAGIAGDHEEGAHPAERGDDVLDQAIGEIFLLGVPAHVGEREDGDRWLFLDDRGHPGLRRGGLRVQRDSIDANGLGDILELLVSPVVESKVKLVGDMVAHRLGYRDPAAVRDTFKAGRDIDAVAKQILAFNDHIAQVDAHPKLDAAILRNLDIPSAHRALDDDGAFNGIHDAWEFHQDSIARQLDDREVDEDQRAEQAREQPEAPEEVERAMSVAGISM